MVKKVIAFTSIAIAVSLTACVSEPAGSLYGNVTGNATLINKDTSQNQGLGAKTGESCASSFLNLVATGDAGIKAAAANGNINNVKAMDVNHTNIIGSLFVQKCTKVYGD